MAGPPRRSSSPPTVLPQGVRSVESKSPHAFALGGTRGCAGPRARNGMTFRPLVEVVSGSATPSVSDDDRLQKGRPELSPIRGFFPPSPSFAPLIPSEVSSLKSDEVAVYCSSPERFAGPSSTGDEPPPLALLGHLARISSFSPPPPPVGLFFCHSTSGAGLVVREFDDSMFLQRSAPLRARRRRFDRRRGERGFDNPRNHVEG